MPHLVEMQQKYGSKGFAVMSVHVENPGNKTDLKKIEGFLRRIDLKIPNYYLDESHALWSAKLGAPGTPLVFTFDRKGQWRKFGDDGEVDAKKLDEFVAKLVQE